MSTLSNYRKKTIFVLIGSAFFLVLAYQLAFKKTWAAYNIQSQLQNQLSAATQAPAEMKRYTELLQEIGNTTSPDTFSQELLFERITLFCQEHQLIIKALPSAIVYQQNNYTIKLYPLKVNGDYKNIVMLLYAIEQKWKIATVASTNFLMDKNQQSRQLELICDIVLQKIDLNK